MSFIKRLIYTLLIFCIVWALFLFTCYAFSALSAGEESELYFVSSFATLYGLILLCVISSAIVDFPIKSRGIKEFIRSNIRQLLIIVAPMPITFCYLGWCIEIYTTQFGPAEIFGFNAAVTGIMFNVSTVFMGLGYVLAVISSLERVKLFVRKLLY